ncbi:non-ribosomal peptide synthase domain TIGR01720/amino acid adenylation domain-containing protein [Nocardiopsis flavescens]|uniref:Non-ribosomal peptide synthase domain TIGR01720/amino acid adenylation domain-containing protein n=1 Tax=Nocardiopsis flavescens TaxID=758803 RepID=A0A1M6J6V9_9ACTN|nr:non-ribosomal peptide synthetase [Nocardiopsis flavescens]SHJ42395.1 non-ribosomal peptide synthase domain TIGR01720/amino acid adenylation domain-containing protein [Nocardiopsis flavescens]
MAANDVTRMRLTGAQAGVRYAQQAAPESPVFNVGQYTDIPADLDTARFAAAVRSVVADTDALRAVVVGDGPEPLQEVGPHVPGDVEVVDLTGDGGEDGARARARAWADADLARPVDVTAGPLYRYALLRVGPRRWLWYQRYHHLAVDAYAITMIARRVADVYTRLGEGREIAPSGFGRLADVVADEQAYAAGPRRGADRAHWARVLAGRPAPALLSCAPPAPHAGFLRERLETAAPVAAGLDALARAGGAGAGATWVDALTGAFAAYVHRLTGERDLLLGVPVMGRLGTPALRTPAMVVNVLPLRLGVHPADTVLRATAAAGAAGRALRAHHRYRAEWLRRDLSAVGERFGLFGPELNIKLFDYALEFDGHRAASTTLSEGPVDDLALSVYRPAGGGLVLEANANAERHDRAGVRARLAGFARLLEGFAAAGPDTPTAALDTVDPAAARLTAPGAPEPAGTGRNGAATTGDRPAAGGSGPARPAGTPFTPVTAMLARALAEDPGRTALVHGRERLTREEFLARVDALARRLRALGAGPERFVALALPRSADLVVALFAVLRSGAAYVPLDPGHPARRTAHVLEDTRPVLVLTRTDTAAALPDTGTARVVLLDAPDAPEARGGGETPENAAPAQDTGGTARVPGDAVTVSGTGVPPGAGGAGAVGARAAGVREGADAVAVSGTVGTTGTGEHDGDLPWPRPGDAAYVIHTSGSTGRPKGVVVEHRALAALAGAQREQLALPPHSRVGHIGAFTFDASWDTLLGLVHGHEFHLVDTDLVFDHARLGDYLAEHRIDHLDTTPAYLWTLLESGRPRHVPRLLTFGGEACPQPLWDRLCALPGVRALNFYGPTENTVDALVGDVADTPDTAIGHPVAGVGALVLDAALRPVPPGVPGELYLDGDRLARGYLGRPGLTAERFVASPLGPPGARMYRTGDRVAVAPDGAVRYLGRADDQVQVRGHRVEPGEVDAAAQTHPGVARCATVARTGPSGAVRLVAYAMGSAALTEEALRAHLAARLPDHMVPARIVVLDRLPLNSSGKVDRDALPDAPGPVPAAEAADPVARTLAALLGEVLGSAVGAHDDFFRLGGDSILAIQAVNRARAAGLEITVRDVFEAPTPAALAARARTGEAAAPGDDDPVGPITPTPVAAALLDQGPPPAGFTQAQALWTPAGLTAGTLERALAAVVAHHGALRLRTRTTAGGTALEVPPAADAPAVHLERVAAEPDDDAVATAAARLRAHIDPEAGRTLAAAWFDAGPDRPGLLLLRVHHLAVDGVSWRVIGPDLAAAVTALDAGRAVDLPAAGTSLRRWTALLAQEARRPERVAELDYWLAVTDPAAHRPRGSRPLDPARDTVAGRRVLDLVLDPDLTRAVLTGPGARHRVNAEDVLLTALTLAGTDQGRLLVEVEGHGRRDLHADADPARTVGWLTSAHPVALDPLGTDPVRALKRTKEMLRAVPGHGLGHGLLSRLNPDTAPLLAGRARPDVLFNHLGRFGAPGTRPFEAAPVTARVMLGEDPGQPLTHGLELGSSVHEGPDGPRLHLSWRWAPGLWDTAGVHALADAFTEALRALAEAADAPGPHALTPSDVPLVDLDQERVERIERAWADRSGDPGARLADLWPPTPLQAGLVFHGLYGGGHDAYTAQSVTRVRGPLDPERLRAAADALLRDHPGLRAGFLADGGDLVQFVPAAVSARWSGTDLSGADDPEAELDALCARELATPFDLAHPPLIRFTLVRRADDDHTLVATDHHTLLDGWSTPLFLRALFDRYADPATPAPALGFRDHLARLATRDADAADAAWRAELGGLDGPTLLAPGAPAHGGAGQEVLTGALAQESTGALTAAARDLGVTVNTLVQTAWGLVLGGATGRTDVVFGATVSGRPADLPGVESILGLFINTVPVRLRTAPGTPVADLARDLQRRQVALAEHHHTALTRTQELAGTSPLFDTLLVFENFPARDALADRDHAGVRLTDVRVQDATHYPVSLNVFPGERLGLRLCHRPDAVDAATARTLLERLRTTLAAIAADPGRTVAATPVTTGAERALAQAPNATARPIDTDRPCDSLTAWAVRTPDAVAVVDAGGEHTYARLAARVERVLALLRAHGVRPGEVIAVALPRTVDLVAALLAVQRLGCTYLPLDPEFPADRTAYMLADSGATLIVTGGGTKAPAGSPVSVLDLDASGPVAVPADADAHGPLAYILYTSGSTGRPKGVVVSHRNLANFLTDMGERFPLEPGERWLAVTTVGFDISALELYLPLRFGATVVLADKDTVRDPRLLAGLLERSGATIAQATPSLWRSLTEHDPAVLDGLRVLVGGEAVPADLAAVLATRAEAAHNVYGPTETTIWSTTAPLTADGPVTIGRPVANTRVHVLDAALRPAPAGVPGDLYIAGEGVAPGYHGRLPLTAERFVADPFGPPGSRMYRTGDLARRNTDGTLDFLGRADFQVKVRGFRIEPGEIEAALGAVEGVAQAVVTAPADPDGNARLVAHLVPDPDAPAPAPAALRAHLARSLPDYMVPSAFVPVDAFPLTANGKIDRNALPDPGSPDGGGDGRGGRRAPATPGEEILCHLFGDVLGRDGVGPDDDFFALGGHSLLATRVAARARTLLGAEAGVRDLFEAPTPAALARRIRQAGPGRPPVVPLRDGRPRLSHAQRRLWLIDRVHEPGGAYNVPLAVRVADPLDEDALRAAAVDLAERHEVLRTVVRAVADEPEPVLLDAGAVAAHVRAERVEGDLDAALARITALPFDLAARPPLRMRLLTGPGVGDGCVLLLVLHHLAADEWSFGPLLADLDTAYRARLDGRAPGWAPLPVRYSDYAAARADLLGGAADPDSPLAALLEHWRRALQGLPDELSLPTDRPRPAVASHRGGLAGVPVDPDLDAALRGLAVKHGVTVFMVVQAAVAVLLHRLGAGDDIPLGSPVADRADEGTQDAVGFFLNTLVLRLDLGGRPTFAELLERVRAVDLAGFAHADAPFDAVVEALAPGRSVSRHPLFQTMVSHQRRPAGAGALFGSATHLLETPLDTARFDLEFAYIEDPGRGSRLALNFSADLFDPGSAERIVRRLVRVLAAAAADPDLPVADIGVLEDGERERLAASHATGAPITAPRPCDALAAWAARTPGGTAVRDAAGEHAYAAVQARTCEVAALLRARGVRPGQVVAVALPRTADLVAALLAVQRVGGVYLPLDPEFPADRTAYMLDDSAAVLLVTGGGTAPPPGTAVPVLDLDTAGPVTGAGEDPEAWDARTGPDRAAYILYTSGSTGRPKGVVVSHRNLANFLTDMGERFPLEPGERWLAVTTVGFDISALELYLPLLSGATVVLADKDTVRDGAALGEVLATGGIGTVQATPTLWRMLLETRPEALDGLRILVGGEALPPDLAEALASRAASVTNVYGPTETTIWSTTAPVCPESPVTIGRPIANTRVHVLDAGLAPVPTGVPGDLYIAGEGVAPGYHGRLPLTAERFVADPFGPPGTRMYRTGDLARRNPDGTLDFLGRADFQVKVRGFRIEPGEIEAALGAVEGVAQAVVSARADDAGHHRLIAHVLSDGTADDTGLRAALAASLPDYMIPSAFVPVDAFPLTANGKIDRNALPDPDPHTGRTVGRAPATDAERALCAVYAHVLGLDRVGADEDFFALGGDSVLTLRLVGAARKAGWQVTGRQVFRHPLVADLAAVAVPAPDTPPEPAAPEEPLISLAPDQMDRLASMWRRRR